MLPIGTISTIGEETVMTNNLNYHIFNGTTFLVWEQRPVDSSLHSNGTSTIWFSTSQTTPSFPVNPSPTVPEFPTLAILPLFVVIPMIIALISRKNKHLKAYN
jgi:hypothetical protein